MSVAGVVRPEHQTEDAEIVQAFLDESRENLDQLDQDLVALEGQPGDAALLGQIFRTIHTIKGTCGFLGFQRLEALSHAGEDLLDALRSDRLRLDARMTTSLLRLVDATRRVLECIDATGDEGDEDHGPVIRDLASYLEAPEGEQRAAETPAALTPAPGSQPSPSDAGHGAESAVRVDVALLDKLMNLVGELVVTRSHLAEVVADDDTGPMSEPLRQLRLVTTELRESVMEARLQPIGTLTAKFHRLARDLGKSLGKRVSVETTGDEVGVDKGIHEALRDALVHLVRNAVDHGIECPADRIAAGKDPEGKLRISASHRGDRVHIEISDDGRGIDPRQLAASAVRSGLLSPAAANALTDTDAINLIFVPGFSTKVEVSNVSGRGVGMDVVRTSLSSVGGAVEVSSRMGEGTEFRIDVPLTVAIMPTVVVWSGGGRYAVPQVYVQEVLHLDPPTAATVISEVGGARIMRRRGKLLPLLELASHLGVTTERIVGDGVEVVVVAIGGRRFGLVVDRVGESAEAVIKPLTSATQAIPMFSGVTLLGDGRPSLILDLDGLATVARLTTVSGDDPVRPGVAAPLPTRLLIASLTGGGRLAIPLAAVRRLEQLPCDVVERSGPLDVVQYGGSVLPLVHVVERLARRGSEQRPSPSPDGLLQTVVCESSIGLIGLVVERIEDVVTESSAVSQSVDAGGLTERAVVGGRIVDLIHIEMLVADMGLI